MALPKNRGVSEGKRKAGKAGKPGAGRPPDPKYERFRWYAADPSFSQAAWWSNVKNRKSVAPNLAPALFWERVRRHPDFPELRAAWLKLNQTAKVDLTILDDFWGEHGGDNVRDALGLICRSWKLDYGALLKADADAGLDPRHYLRTWPRGGRSLRGPVERGVSHHHLNGGIFSVANRISGLGDAEAAEKFAGRAGEGFRDGDFDCIGRIATRMDRAYPPTRFCYHGANSIR